jgi:predicted lipid-binding transport protein (Tim44 family)
MNQIFDPLNLALAGVAIFILWRLRSVLGQRTGTERPPTDLTMGRKAPTAEPVPGKILDFPKNKQEPEPVINKEPEKPVWEGFAPSGSTLATNLEKLNQSDSTFTPKAFLSGAKLAYEMIVEAFAKGDKAALKNLLSKDVFDGFSKAIDARQKTGEKLDFQFVGFEKADILTAVVLDKRANITVKFVSELISATYDKAGTLMDGDPKEIRDITDIWSFERDITQKDPNWRVVSTETQN